MDIFRASNTAWGRLLGSQGLKYDQFFLNPLTREMYRDKIRYVVARWGYSTNIFSWEFWNEIESVEPKEGIFAWMREMTAYLRSVDPWRHLIKSSAHHE
jgi:endo-1,4-beta-mannosidase